MGTRCGDLVATDESAVVAKPFLDPIVVEDGQGNGRFPNPPWTNESGWGETFSETNDLLDQFVASKTDPWRRRRRFSRRDAMQM